MRQLSLPKVTTFKLWYSQFPIPAIPAASIIADHAHPLYIKEKRKYEERDRSLLWWSVYSLKKEIYQAVVRVWCGRRIKAAFKRALKERGYDHEGRRTTRVEGGDGSSKGVFGSARFQISAQTITASRATIDEHARMAVDAIELNCFKSPKPNPKRPTASHS